MTSRATSDASGVVGGRLSHDVPVVAVAEALLPQREMHAGGVVEEMGWAGGGEE